MNIEKIKLKDGSEYPLGSAYFDGVSIDVDIDTETDTAEGQAVQTMTTTVDAGDGSEPTTTTETMTTPLRRLNFFDDMALTDSQMATMWLSDFTVTEKSAEPLLSLNIPRLICSMMGNLGDNLGLPDKIGTGFQFDSDEANEYTPFYSGVVSIFALSQSDIDSFFSADDQGNYVCTRVLGEANTMTITVPSAGVYYANMFDVQASFQGLYITSHFTLNIGTYHIFDKTYLYPKLSNTIFVNANRLVRLSDSKLKQYYSLYYDTRTEAILQNAKNNFDDICGCFIVTENDNEIWQYFKLGDSIGTNSFYAWMSGGVEVPAATSSIWLMSGGISYLPDYTTNVTSSTSKTITVDNKLYEEAVKGNQGSTVFTFDGTNWSCNNGIITHLHPSFALSDLGITYPEGETPVADETITIDGRGHCIVFMLKQERVTES